MSWKEHKFVRGGPPRPSPAWRVSVFASGTVFFIPSEHPLARIERVKVFFGEDVDAGWMLLLPTEDVAGSRKISKNPRGRAFLTFRAFPGLDRTFRFPLTELETKSDPSGTGIALRLPWFSKEEPVKAPPSTDPVTLPSALVDVLTRVPTGPTDSLVSPLSKSSTDDAKVKEFLAARGSACVMSLEQVAEYVRGMGRRCTVREDGATRASSGAWVRRTTVLLDGQETPPEKLFAVMNSYRQARDLPPVAPPPAPTTAVA